MAPPLSDIVAALHLLMGDLDTDSRAFVLREAFPDIMTIEKGDPANRAIDRVQWTMAHINTALKVVDGSSGLGAIAAANAHRDIEAARNTLRDAMKLLRIRERFFT